VAVGFVGYYKHFASLLGFKNHLVPKLNQEQYLH